MTLPEAMRKAISVSDADLLRQGVKVLAEAVMAETGGRYQVLTQRVSAHAAGNHSPRS